MRVKINKHEVTCTEEGLITMDHKKKKSKMKGCHYYRCCGCIRVIKLILVLLIALMLLNIFTGLNFDNPVIAEVMKKIVTYMYPADIQNLSQSKERLEAMHKQCRQEPNSFADLFNKTLYSYANTDTSEARLKYALSEMLDGRFSIPFDRRLRKAKFAFMRARFKMRLKTLAKNMRLGYDPRVMQKLLSIVKMHTDMHYQSMNLTRVNLYQRYNTCAVIGNSGELMNSTRGDFIDGHDAVIRVNNVMVQLALTRSLSKPLSHYIGSKTTIMFMNSHILHKCSKLVKCKCHSYGIAVPIVLYLCDVEHIWDVSMCGSEHKTPLFVTDRRFDLLVTKIARWYSLRKFFISRGGFHNSKWRQWELLHAWERKHKHEFHYSSGMQAVVFALGVCEHVDLLGFGKNPLLKHHFHSLQKIEHYGHDYAAEYAFYDDLVNGRVNANPFLCEADVYIPPLRVFH